MPQQRQRPGRRQSAKRGFWRRRRKDLRDEINDQGAEGVVELAIEPVVRVVTVPFRLLLRVLDGL
jgi:hypothetical protein